MSDLTILTEDAPGLPGSSGSGQWGLFTASGSNALDPDNTLSFDFKQEWRIANYPIEDGGFVSYDKVKTPFEIRLTVTKGGSDADRSAFLANAKSVAQSIDLYTAVTPDDTYPNCNVARWSFKRTHQSGVTLITVEFALVQINVTASGTVTTTASPNGAAQSNDGTVQSGTPDQSQSSAISNAGPPHPPEVFAG